MTVQRVVENESLVARGGLDVVVGAVASLLAGEDALGPKHFPILPSSSTDASSDPRRPRSMPLIRIEVCDFKSYR